MSLLGGHSMEDCRALYCSNSCLCLWSSPYTDCNCGGEHDFDDFRKNKPVETEAHCLRYGKSENDEPPDSAGKQHYFCQQSRNGGASKRAFSCAENQPGDSGHERIGHQESTGETKQLCDSALAHGVKDRHSGNTLDQIQDHCHEPAACAQGQPDQQHAKILEGERNWGEGQGHSHLRAERNEQARTQYDCSLLGPIERTAGRVPGQTVGRGSTHFFLQQLLLQLARFPIYSWSFIGT